MKRICLGKIVAAQGLKGEVKILPYGENPGLMETLGPMFTSADGPETLMIQLKNPSGKYFVAAVEGIADRDAAEALRGTPLYIPKNALPPIKEKNTWYHADLIGLNAVDQNGAPAGKVIDVQNFGAGDFLDIQPEGAESYYLPFTDDTVLEVDIGQGFVKIIVPETI